MGLVCILSSASRADFFCWYGWRHDSALDSRGLYASQDTSFPRGGTLGGEIPQGKRQPLQWHKKGSFFLGDS